MATRVLCADVTAAGLPADSVIRFTPSAGQVGVRGGGLRLPDPVVGRAVNGALTFFGTERHPGDGQPGVPLEPNAFTNGGWTTYTVHVDSRSRTAPILDFHIAVPDQPTAQLVDIIAVAGPAGGWVTKGEQGEQGPVGPEGPTGPAGGSDTATASWISTGTETPVALAGAVMPTAPTPIRPPTQLAARNTTTTFTLPTGLHARYDATSIAVADGAALSSWADSSGNARNLAQATAALQPVFDIDGLNGLPAVKFTASASQQLVSATFTALPQPTTVFVVVKHATATVPANRVVVDSGVTVANTRRQVLLATNRQWATYINTPVTTYTGVTVDPSAPTVAAAVFADDYGLIQTSGGLGASSAGGIPPADPTAWSVGANNNGASGWDGWISEVLIFSRRLSASEIASVEQYLAAKWALPMIKTGEYWVDTAAGSDSNHGRLRTMPLATPAQAFTKMLADTAPAVTMRLRTPTPYRGRVYALLATSKDVTVDSWDQSETWEVWGSVAATGWANEGSGVYSVSRSSDPLVVADRSVSDPEHPGYARRLTAQTTNLTAPAQGTYTWDAAATKVRVRLWGDADPSTHNIELGSQNDCVSTQDMPGRLVLRNGVGRYWRNRGLNIAGTKVAALGVHSFAYCENVEFSHATEGFGTYALTYSTIMVCVDCRAFHNSNDGFNHHTPDGHKAVMELWNCEGAYNGDEGASPHESGILRVYGGVFHHNKGGGGITGVGNARMEVDGATCFANRTPSALDPQQGGISFYEPGTSGWVRRCVVHSNNGGGVFVAPGAAVQVDTATVSLANASADTF